MSEPLRHRDPAQWAGQFADKVFVTCPRCGKAAVSRRGAVACGACGFAAADRWFGPVDVSAKHWRCGQCGATVSSGRTITDPAQGVPPTLTVRCRSCGHQHQSPVSEGRRGSFDRDPGSGLPLSLTVELAGGTLCAYNAAHAKALLDFIAADLRERGDRPPGKTMLTVLPAWIKAAKNRAAVAKGYQALYERGLALESET